MLLELQVQDFYSGINDDQLKESIASIVVEQPNTGTKLMKGMLFTKFGIRVPEERLRRTMREVDPDGVENRRRRNRAIVRRSYYVPFAHSIWHIDGNLKCVRYSDFFNLNFAYTFKCKFNNQGE